MVYITLIVAANVLFYKIADFGVITLTVGSFITPFWFVITDIVAEVYGYQMTRKLIWSGLFCATLFMIICVTFIHLPSPDYWPHQSSYNQVLGKMPRILLGCIIGITLSMFANTYLLSKWKLLMRGKYFWLRSLGSSSVGQLTFTVITISFDLFGETPFEKIVHLISVSLSLKIFFSIFLAVPSTIVVNILKKIENVDIYDYNTNFNPFKLQVTN
jgi:uncharacterized integral membrane protein (TIGR00697 family)